MNKFKITLLVVFIGLFLISASVFAAVDNFEASPSGGLFNEGNLAPGDQITRILTLTNNTGYVQKVKFWAEKSLISNIFPWIEDSPLSDKIFIEVKDGNTTLFAKDTLANFKNQKVQLDLPPGSKDLTFTAYFDESADNSYQGTSVSFDLKFVAEWEEGSDTEEVPGTAPGGTVAGAGVQRGIVGEESTGMGARTGEEGILGAGDVLGAFLGAEDFSPDLEAPSPEKPSKEKKPLFEEEPEEPRGFWNRLGAAVGDILPPLCVDWTSLFWLIIGIGIGNLGHYLLNKKWGSSVGGGTQMAFLGFLWSKCSFWWLIIGMIIGYIIADLLRRNKRERKKQNSRI